MRRGAHAGTEVGERGPPTLPEPEIPEERRCAGIVIARGLDGREAQQVLGACTYNTRNPLAQFDRSSDASATRCVGRPGIAASTMTIESEPRTTMSAEVRDSARVTLRSGVKPGSPGEFAAAGRRDPRSPGGTTRRAGLRSWHLAAAGNSSVARTH